MDNFDDKDIATLLRLKRHEQPPAAYFDSFLHEFHRRQRAELLRQPLWRIALQRAQDFMFQLNVPALSSYPVAATAVILCAAVFSLRVYEAHDGGNSASVAMQQTAAVVAPVHAAWSLSSIPSTRDIASLPVQANIDSVQTHRLAAPPRYVLDSTPVSYEPASFRF